MISNNSKPVSCFKRWCRKGYAIFASLNKVVKIGMVTFTCTLVQAEYQSAFATTEKAVSDEVSLREIEISASPSELRDGSTRIIGVIEKKDIEAAPLHSINDLLKILPGIDIRQRGSDGIQADVSIRGGSFDQVMILLNGVNITDPQTGHYSLDLPIDLSQIEKIEILQGSDARICGPNGFSGAVNIITYSNKKGPSAKADVSGGSYGRFKSNIAATYTGKKFSINGSGGYKRSDGYIDNTDYKTGNAFLRASYSSPKAGLFQYQAGFNIKDFGANSFYALAYPHQGENTKTLFTSLDWAKNLNNIRLSSNIYERRHHDRFELYRDYKDGNGVNAPSWYTNHNYHITDVFGGNFISTLYSVLGKSTLGADIRDEHIYSNVLGNPMNKDINDIFDDDAFFTKHKNRINYRLFIEESLSLNKLEVSAGISANYNTDYDYYWFGGADISYKFNSRLKAYISYNRALRLPTFTDLYYKSSTQSGNINLNPEKSGTTEFAIKYADKKISGNISTWYRNGKNIIDWVKHPDSTKWESKNFTKINAFGVDADFTYKIAAGILNSVSCNYSYMNLDKDAGTYDSKYALDYLKNKLNITADFTVLRFNRNRNIGLNLNYGFYERAGTYTDFNTGNLKKYDNYNIINGRISFNLKNLCTYIDLNNIFDKEYEDLGGLKQPGFNFTGGIKVTL